MEDMKSSVQMSTLLGVGADIHKELAEPTKAEITRAKGVVGGLAAAAALIAEVMDKIARDDSIDKEVARVQVDALKLALNKVQESTKLNQAEVLRREGAQEAYKRVQDRLQNMHKGVQQAAARRRASEAAPEEGDYEPPARRSSPPAGEAQSVPPAATSASPSAPPAKSKPGPKPKAKKG